MTIKRRLKISVTRIRRQRLEPAGLRAFCPRCAREVETLALSHAAEVLEVAADTLHNLLVAGHLHAIETVSGSLRVCRPSLFPQPQKEN